MAQYRSSALRLVQAAPFRLTQDFLDRCRATRERGIRRRAKCEALQRRVDATLARAYRLLAAASRTQ